MINPDFLKTFSVLAETGHFTRTAEKLNMTQPGVSQHLRKLEAHFGVALLRRQGKSFTLTDHGRRVALYAQQLFKDYSRFESTITEDSPSKGLCRFASPGSFGFRLFDALLKAASRHPDLRVSLSVAPNNSIPDLLLKHQIDVGFMTRRPEDPLLSSSEFGEEDLLLLVPKGRRVKVLDDLLTIGFVNHPDGFFFATRLLQPNFPESFHVAEDLPVRVFINQISRILDPVAEGLGFTILPAGAYEKYGGKKSLSVVRLKERVSDQIYRVQRRHEVLPLRYETVERLIR